MSKKVLNAFILLVTGVCLGTTGASAKQGSFGFLDPIDQQPYAWEPESSASSGEAQDPIEVSLRQYHQEFTRDGKISIYIGYGHEAWFPERAAQIFEMLKILGGHYGLTLTDWRRSEDGSIITFRDAGKALFYEITIEGDRNRFINAFATHEIVMYHGHSRNGKGPAFGAFENYFRMGRKHPSLEVDTRNIYFRNEPMLKTKRYPPLMMTFLGQTFLYQYRGQKHKKSKLPHTSFTKNIPGMDKDFMRTRFLPGKQFFYFYSCKNRKYWRDSIRSLFPDLNHKMVFGTFEDAFGGTKPEALMIMSVVRQLQNSGEVLELLNASKDCENCFTNY
ncbi:MAG: hypothetical protein A2Z97_04915 [Bdellovibrionales bacterium GWB1_52_6]|nr:MAG: hypothetical protein A2Z97_04915 [Bdellovibrionales bacterium GWB1_52_6]OFZ03880.1 MAG: hypothetical protein A2X97_15890 [Bdellovibrionales bacterium GWA1_52_35]HCM39685.1 hypothetical protein [Bdellovibrionales bacterium]